MSLRGRYRIAMALLVTILPGLAWAGELDDLDWIVGTWSRQARRGEVFERWTRLSPRTIEGESWIVTSADGTTRPIESLLLVEMAGEVFYIPKVAENEYPVAFRHERGAVMAADGFSRVSDRQRFGVVAMQSQAGDGRLSWAAHSVRNVSSAALSANAGKVKAVRINAGTRTVRK